MRLNKILAGLFSLGLILCPLTVSADETIVAQSQDGIQTYTDIASAWSAAQDGTTIVMMDDWILSDRLIVDEGKSVYLEMNGHKIDRNLNAEDKSDGEVIYLSKDSTLTLTSDSDATFNFKGYNATSTYTNVSLESGGLVTGGASSNGGGGIHMKKGSTLNLSHVAVAGNKCNSESSSNGGGIDISDDNCTLNMVGSTISYNGSRYAGGIGIYGSHALINMESSSIDYNFADQDGGGIYYTAIDGSINMAKNSKMNGNHAGEIGGAIRFRNSDCQLVSSDASAEISYNSCSNSEYGGGAIYLTGLSSGDDPTIDGITFDSNTTTKDNGGAIYVSQKHTTIKNCVFKNNTAKSGGAICLMASYTTVSNCTFQGNSASKYGGAIYDGYDDNTIDSCVMTDNKAEVEGGAIYVNQNDDITLSGTLMIQDNHRGGNYDDDLFLQKTFFATAYVKGEVTSDSRVGIRTADNGETQIGTDIKSDCSKSFFLNDSGQYHVSYESGTLYKRSGTLLGSIFGNANLGIAILVMGGIVIIGAACLVIHKKKTVNN